MKGSKISSVLLAFSLLFVGSVSSRAAHAFYHSIRSDHFHHHDDQAKDHSRDHNHSDGKDHHEIASVKLPVIALSANSDLEFSIQQVASIQPIYPSWIVLPLDFQFVSAGLDPPILLPFSPTASPSNRAPPL